jgi:hypothetical protein
MVVAIVLLATLFKGRRFVRGAVIIAGTAGVIVLIAMPLQRF